MRVSILKGSESGSVVFSETHQVTTNSNGLATLVIGSGTPGSGAIAGIDWGNGPYFIRTEADITGGTSYSLTGTSQLLSVPYALYASRISMRASFTGDTLYTGQGNYIIIPGLSAANLPCFVFTKTVSGYDQLFTANLDFSTVRQITFGNLNCWHPRISPDGKKVAYAKGVPGSYVNVWTINIDGSGDRQVTNQPDKALQLPAWHNNGKEIKVLIFPVITRL